MRKLMLGLYDDPQNQAQPPYSVNLLRSNIVVIGSAMSGKTTFVRNLLVRLQEAVMPGGLREEVYIIDFGGNIGKYRDLCCIRACFDNSNEENVRRILKTVESRLDSNTDELNAESFESYTQHSQNAEKMPTHLTLIIENVNAFLGETRYQSYQEMLMKFCRDGISKGLTVVLTAVDLNGGLMRYLNYFGCRIGLGLLPDQYSDLFGSRPIQPLRLPGRGLINLQSDVLEFQCFLPFEDEKREFETFLGNQRARYHPEELPDRLQSFSKVLTADNFSDNVKEGGTVSFYEKTDNTVVVGLEYYDHQPICLDLEHQRSFAIFGKRQYGKSNLLCVIVRRIMEAHPDYRFVLWDDGRSQLEHLTKFLPPDRYELFKSPAEFRNFLRERHYYQPISGTPGVETQPVISNRVETLPPIGGAAPAPLAKPAYADEEPPTVFIMQSKEMYLASECREFLTQIIPGIASVAENKKCWMIFSEVRRTQEKSVGQSLGNYVSVAFLLDDIADFVSERSAGTLFSEMDAKELRQDYAPCNLGDGYYYDNESDELKKVKFLKGGDIR